MRHASATLIAPRKTPNSCEFVARPKMATSGVSRIAGSGGNGSSAYDGFAGAARRAA